MNTKELKTAFNFAATELEKVQRYESEISESLASGGQVDNDTVIGYAKVINSYCDALDLMENFGKEQALYEKSLDLLSRYGSAHPEQINIKMMTIIKYAQVLWKQKKYKKSGEALRKAVSYMLDNLKDLSSDPIDINFIKRQLP